MTIVDVALAIRSISEPRGRIRSESWRAGGHFCGYARSRRSWLRSSACLNSPDRKARQSSRRCRRRDCSCEFFRPPLLNTFRRVSIFDLLARLANSIVRDGTGGKQNGEEVFSC